MSAEAPASPAPASGRGLLRDRSGEQRVTNIELFFDLVYVFAVTQLSHYLLGRTTIAGAGQTAILLAMVWLAWMYTTWVTNWLDPERMAVRLLLVLLMLVSLDPGRLGRTAYHLIHPVMVAGIIVAAAGDEKILTHPSSTASAPSAWLILGGPALFMAGHAAFKSVVWRVVPRTRLAGLAVLALLALAVPVLPEIALAACAAVTVAAVAATDRRPHPGAAGPTVTGSAVAG